MLPANGSNCQCRFTSVVLSIQAVKSSQQITRSHCRTAECPQKTKNNPNPTVVEVPQCEQIQRQVPFSLSRPRSNPSSKSQSHTKSHYETSAEYRKQSHCSSITTGRSSQPIPKYRKVTWSKGSCPDSATFESLGAKSGSKFMTVGSSNLEVTLKARETSETVGLGELTMHRKILDKGVPADAMPGILDEREALPAHPISGMLNKQGMAARLTFKLESDEVWLGTKERTEKIKLGQVRKVVNEPVLGPEYHVLGLQLGPTEASTYWLYWVPAQVFSQFD